MATKYHISQDGTINVCSARIRKCRLSSAQEHFASVEEAEQYLDRVYAEKMEADHYEEYQLEKSELDTFYDITESLEREASEARYEIAQQNGLLIDPTDLNKAWEDLRNIPATEDYSYRPERVALIANPFMNRATVESYIDSLEPYEQLTLLEETPQTLPSWIAERMIISSGADEWDGEMSPDEDSIHADSAQDALRRDNEYRLNLLYSAIPNLSEVEGFKYATRDVNLADQYLKTNGWPTHLDEAESARFEASIRQMVVEDVEKADLYYGVAGRLATNAKEIESIRISASHPTYSVRLALANSKSFSETAAGMLISSASENQYIGNYPSLRHEMFYEEGALPSRFRMAFINDSTPSQPESASFPGSIEAQKRLVADLNAQWEAEKKVFDAAYLTSNADQISIMDRRVRKLRQDRDNAEAWVDAVDSNYEKLSKEYSRVTSPEGARRADPSKRADIMGRYDAATAFRLHEGDMKLLARLMFNLDADSNA